MKKYFFISIVLSVLVAALAGCADQNSTLTTQTSGTGAAVGTASGSSVVSDPINTTEIHITVDGKNKVSIPNPATAEGEINISLRDPKMDSVLGKCGQCEGNSYGEYCDNCKDYFYENYFTDLSFAGFDKPVHISSYAIGYMAEKNSSSPRFYVKEKGATKEEEKGGNCLTIFVTDLKGKISNEMNSSLQEGNNYLVILDYQNKCCYKTETDFHNNSWTHRNDMKFTDLTGDGREELVIQHNYNKSIDLEIHRLNDKKKLKKIFTTWDVETADMTSFSGYLEDNYKAVLKYKEIGFTETVSLLDAGYKKENLETDQLPQGYEYDDYQFVRLWKNSKLQKEGKDPETVFLYTLDQASFVKNKKDMPQLRLLRGVYVGHRSDCIGDMYTYFQYDEEKETMELSAAKFKIDKE